MGAQSAHVSDEGTNSVIREPSSGPAARKQWNPNPKARLSRAGCRVLTVAGWPPGEKSEKSQESGENMATVRFPTAAPSLGPLSGSHEVTGNESPGSFAKPPLTLLGWGRLHITLPPPLQSDQPGSPHLADSPLKVSSLGGGDKRKMMRSLKSNFSRLDNGGERNKGG